MLLFVRERAHVNVWSWLQAKLDPDIDLVKQVDVTGGNSQQEADQQDVCDMSQSQDVGPGRRARRRSATTCRVLPGLDRRRPLRPASPTVEGAPTVRPDRRRRRSRAEAAERPVEDREVARGRHDASRSGSIRAGQTADRARAGRRPPQNTHVIGVELALRYTIPLDIDLDTSDISGPSAGLAMTLAIIDDADARRPDRRQAGRGHRHHRPRRQRRRDRRPAAEGGRGPGRARADLHRPGLRGRPAQAACQKDLATAKKRVGKNVELASGRRRSPRR